MIEPNELDWLNIGNDLRKIFNDLHEQIDGTRPYKMEKVGRIPTTYELEEFDKVCPGSADKFREMAMREAEHRIKMENLRKKAWRIEGIFYLICLWVMLAGFIVLLCKTKF